MKIAVLCMTTYRCPPRGYGGEVFIWHLAKGLCELGHDVTLYAAGGSRPPHANCRCTVRYLPGCYGSIDLLREWTVVDWYYDEIVGHDRVIDAMHNHPVAEVAGWYYPQHSARIAVVLNGVTSNTPRCGPYNVVVGSEKWRQLLIAGRTQFYATDYEPIYGASLPHPVPPQSISKVIPWGTDTSYYTPGNIKEDYLLWISRPTPYKGLSQALQVAAKAKCRLKIVPGIGNSTHSDELSAYAGEIEAARAAGAIIEIEILPSTGSHHEIKRELYRRARALLFPVQCHEPFGLIVVEALSCGVPVIASNMGAMPEIVQHGKTGFVCGDVDSMVAAVQAATTISPIKCREDVKRRFDYRIIARQYVDMLE